MAGDITYSNDKGKIAFVSTGDIKSMRKLDGLYWSREWLDACDKHCVTFKTKIHRIKKESLCIEL